MKRAAAAIAAAAAPGFAGAAGCGAALDARHRIRIESPSHTVAFAPLPAPWRSAHHFALDIEVCPRGQASMPVALRVDADMPAHRHGMNYAATVRQTAPGRYRAEGLMFHMPGRWRVIFDLSADGKVQHLAREVEVP